MKGLDGLERAHQALSTHPIPVFYHLAWIVVLLAFGSQGYKLPIVTGYIYRNTKTRSILE